MTEYDDVRRLANRANYKEFTSLQEESFRDENFFDLGKWLFIIGATGSGKTLVALLSYFHERQKFMAQGQSYKMLFAVPYRALAAQKTDEISELAASLGLRLKIVQSTSEHTIDDQDVIDGNVDIAIIINEKIFMFANIYPDFLERYDLIVLDEIALIQDFIRGMKMDLILLKAKDFPSLRVIALGTPFYDWREYVEKFGFIKIVETTRPIDVKEFPVFFSQSRITHVEEGCRAIEPEKFSTGQFKESGSRLNYIVTIICKYHLQQNEKIIIFLNSRQQVRELSRAIQTQLVDSGILTPWIDEADCKKFILREIQAESDEILYGAMDDNDYRAFAHGISYHNADMPSTLRYMIERDLLSDEGHLRIVCSTETLAYGINSTTDVVIIPHMEKKNYGVDDSQKLRFLYPNEYMNYSGRAGRLNPAVPISAQKRVGYVYPILQESQKYQWELLREQIGAPEVTFSKCFDVNESFWPLYVLSLFTNRGSVSGKVLGAEDLLSQLKKLPLPPTCSIDELVGHVSRALSKLLAKKLISADDDDSDDLEPKYSLTDTGAKIAGFIISFDDFEKILDTIRTYVTDKNFFPVDLFYSIFSAPEFLKRCQVIVRDFQTIRQKDNIFLPQTVIAMENIFRAANKKTSFALYQKITADLAEYKRLFQKNKHALVVHEDKFRVQRLLAAILLWRSGECSPRKLYDDLQIHYEQMRRLRDIVSYHIYIVQYGLRIAPGKKSNRLLRNELGLERLNAVERQLEDLARELVYQPSNELCDLLGVNQIHCDLYKAQKLQAADRLYSELVAAEKSVDLSAGRRKNLLNDLSKIPKPWRIKLAQRFPRLLKRD